MWKFRWPIIFILIGVGQSWNIFPQVPQGALKTYAKQKISTLKNLRNVLQAQGQKEWTPPEERTTIPTEISQHLTSERILEIANEISYNSTELTLPSVASIVGNLTLSSKESRDNFLQQLLPKRDFLKKISEIREKLEPEVKKYLTDKYNSFLNNLVPYSETIGVPPYVLNSMKIPQNFDPRWQLIESLLEPFSGNQLTHDIDNKAGAVSSKIQSRNDDQEDQELVSDQEPDATSKGQKKYMYLAPRNRHKNIYMNPDRTGYEISFDSVGEPHETYTKGYYLDEYPYATKNDLIALGGSHVARGHSHRRGDHGHGGGGGGYGHGHGGGGGHSMIDPFSILGGLAFLTYLGLLIQQALANSTAAGRSFSGDGEWNLGEDNIMRRIPVVLTKLSFNEKLPEPTETEGQESSGADATVKIEQKLVEDPAVRNLDLRVDTKSLKSVRVLQCKHLCQIARKLRIRQKQGKGLTSRRQNG